MTENTNPLGNFMAVRFSTNLPPKSRKCGSGNAEKMADAIGAKASRIKSSRVLFSAHRLRPITSIVGRMRKCWTAFTQPIAGHDGIRLAPMDCVPIITDTYNKLTEQLKQAVSNLNAERDTIVSEAMAQLGEEFHAADYPASFDGCCSISIDFPVVTPDERLKKLDPALYQEELDKIVAQAKAGCEKMFDGLILTMNELVTRMIAILTPDENGKMKRFRKDTLESWDFLFQRFEMLTKDVQGVRKDNLADVVAKAQELLGGMTADKMRSDVLLQQTLKDGFEQLSNGMTALVETVPDRAIILPGDEEDTDDTDGSAGSDASVGMDEMEY